MLDETADKNPRFKKVFESYRKFRDDQVQWLAVAEHRFDSFVIVAQRLAKA